MVEDLIIPHLHLIKRNFVLVPLVEICPELIHPVLNKPFTDFITSDKGKVVKTSISLKFHL